MIVFTREEDTKASVMWDAASDAWMFAINTNVVKAPSEIEKMRAACIASCRTSGALVIVEVDPVYVEGKTTSKNL